RSRRVPSRPSFPRAPPPPHISPLSLHDALPIFPPGLPPSVLEPVEDPLGDLVLRYARTHVPFAAADLAGRYGIGRAVAVDALRRLVQSGVLAEGDLLPAECDGRGGAVCGAGVPRRRGRRTLRAWRAGGIPGWSDRGG